MKRYFDFDMNDYKDRKCNFHSHTVRCQHAVGEEREYVEEAIKEGFEVIGFSDHSPYLFKNGYVSRIRMTMYQLEDYVKAIEALKKEYREDITIFLALEMEYFPGIFEPTIEEIRQYPMDYLLLAQHFFYENESFISVRKNWTDEMHLKSYSEERYSGNKKIVGVVPLRFFNPKPASALKYPDGWSGSSLCSTRQIPARPRLVS